MNEVDKNYIDIEKQYRKVKNKLIFKNMLFLFLVIFLTSIFILSNIAATSNSGFSQTIQKNSFIKQISHLIAADTKKLQGEKDGRTNILIMGMGGEGHDGPYLTDTIILLSYNYDTKEISMVSIPRDLLVRIDNGQYKKVNSLYTIGEQIKKGYGMKYEKEIVSKNIGIPIHYAMIIDFYGFKEVVDALGGVDVIIDNSFVDYQYPTYNHKVQKLIFKKGKEHMTGERALQFSRSRHGIITEGTGTEGNDFARSKRQFKIINAVKEKVLSFSTITNPSKIVKMFNILNKYIQTDVESWEAIRFAEILRTLDQKNILNSTISDAPDSILQGTTSTYDGAYVLIPRNYDYTNLKNYFLNIFEQKDARQIEEENPVIIILNGTDASGLASKVSQKLKSSGLEIRSLGNADKKNYETTIIYDLSKNKKPKTLETIQSLILGARSTAIPDELKNTLEEGVDFLIILGKDQK